MQLIRRLHNVGSKFASGSVVTIGNYDGVHLGHQEILAVVKQKSYDLRLPSVVVIFEPHPEEFFTQNQSFRLTNLREKLFLLKEQGIDWVLLLPFNPHLATLTALEFIDLILIDGLRVKHLVIGDDFVFGHGRKGDFDLLQKEGVNACFQVTELPSFKINGVRVSSSLIRAALLQGDLELATKLLGRSYRVNGKVVHGDKIGRDLGFPTANVYLKKETLPLAGVYLVKVYGLGRDFFFGLANIGFRPTVGGEHKLFEVYILDFNRDIYGQRVVIEFCEKIRNEQKFDSLEELRQQIAKDVLVAKSFMNQS